VTHRFNRFYKTNRSSSRAETPLEDRKTALERRKKVLAHSAITDMISRAETPLEDRKTVLKRRKKRTERQL
jgi:hypothetical protein